MKYALIGCGRMPPLIVKRLSLQKALFDSHLQSIPLKIVVI